MPRCSMRLRPVGAGRDDGQRGEGMSMQKVLITLGLLIFLLGLLWPLLARLGLGHLPGDIRMGRPGFQVFFPLGTSLLLSILASLLLTLILWLWRR